MTHAKTKEGQAVASEMKRQEAGYWKARLWDHDAIAAAAIAAARESEASGDKPRCDRCNGRGFEPGGHGADCRDCHGRGHSPVVRDFPIWTDKCNVCAGTGFYDYGGYHGPCDNCPAYGDLPVWKTTPPAPTLDGASEAREREHGRLLSPDKRAELANAEPDAARLAQMAGDMCMERKHFNSDTHQAFYDTLLRERAAVRAECQAEIENLRTLGEQAVAAYPDAVALEYAIRKLSEFLFPGAGE